jgi:hypothetical protein
MDSFLRDDVDGALYSGGEGKERSFTIKKETSAVHTSAQRWQTVGQKEDGRKEPSRSKAEIPIRPTRWLKAAVEFVLESTQIVQPG